MRLAVSYLRARLLMGSTEAGARLLGCPGKVRGLNLWLGLSLPGLVRAQGQALGRSLWYLLGVKGIS